jgi:hypothetical protein
MTHYHANVTTSGQPEGLFAHEWQARAHLASHYGDLSRFALESVVQYEEDCEELSGEISALQDFLRLAIAVGSGDGVETEHGREWEDAGDYAWFDRCDNAECGPWTWEPALAS